jgi:hypothetical protein
VDFSVDTDDDRFSSSHSDSHSSSDFDVLSSLSSEPLDLADCAYGDDPWACLRVANEDKCHVFTEFNEDTCLCEYDPHV